MGLVELWDDAVKGARPRTNWCLLPKANKGFTLTAEQIK